MSKEIRRAEQEDMNIHPPINALVSPLVVYELPFDHKNRMATSKDGRR